MKSKLTSLSDEVHLEKSRKLSLKLNQLLLDLKVIQNKLTFGIFSPIQKEPLWFLEFGDKFNGQTAYPVCTLDEMNFHLADEKDLVQSKVFLELMAPLEKCPIVKPEILVIPGLCFTKGGERLGRGKGFYDKYLATHSSIKIGLAFEEQLEEQLATISEAHDAKMNYVVTDQNIYS
jgi:5-formyltetrahydrofolate cyclo-ligase